MSFLPTKLQGLLGGTRGTSEQILSYAPQALVSFKKYMPPSSSSLLQGKYLPFSPSPLRLNIFRLFVILSLTQLYRYTLLDCHIKINLPGLPQTNWTRIFSERRMVYFSYH
jgi:hypothetical protein